MTRVFFGVKTSPFIFAATIKYHFKKCQNDKPGAYKTLNSSLYVDDLYYVAEHLAYAFSLSTDAIKILAKAGMNLRKLKTNCNESNYMETRVLRKC